MKKIIKYSQKKFLQFPPAKQQKIIVEYIKRTTDSWYSEDLRKALLSEFINCLQWMEITVSNDLQNASIRKFLDFAVPLERKFGQELTDLEILQQDGRRDQIEKRPLSLILDNLRSSFNVGSIFRSADCFGVDKIFICGYTATPQNRKVLKTAMGTTDHVEWQQFEKTEDSIIFLKNNGITIYALETTTAAKDISEVTFAKPAALILGNEALGISQEILKLADEVIAIPLAGWKNSLNVAATAAIACHEICRQWNEKKSENR